MPRALIRFLLEAGFLIAVAAVLGFIHPSWELILFVMAIAWLLTVFVEHSVSRPRVVRLEPAPEAVPQLFAAESGEGSGPSEPGRLRRWLQRPPPPPPVPEDLPERAPVTPEVPQPALAGEPVPSAPLRSNGPREWNLWELERLVRDAAGADTARDEERGFLLIHLREYANADGLLPVDFDGLVRESFGDLIARERR